MIDVGKITGAHGLKGEVKIIPLTSNPKRFKVGSKMLLAADGMEVTVSACRSHKEMLIVRFREISDRNEAEAVRGSLLQIPNEEAAPLKKDEYYFFQLENLPVYTGKGELLGTMKDMTSNGANDVYRVDMGGGDYFLVPALRSVITNIDLEEGRIIVDLPPGLLEACKYHED
ncbi:MAG: ribosome maturation factor RimM [Bacillota bacterium]|nr:ribosome maturation factor RimM [Bacillota bacterium]